MRMSTNVGSIDRAVRAVVGLILFGFAFTLGGVWAWIAAIVGLVLLGTAFVSFCPLYSLLGMSTQDRSRGA
jgi:hypothetical protein